MVALLVSVLVLLAMVGIVVRIAVNRPPNSTLTWGEAFLAATFVFTLLFVAYGVVPHQWLAWADNELGWRKDSFFFGEDGISFFGRGRILIPQEVLRDVIAAGIYGVFLGANFAGWIWWQRRGRAPAQRPEILSAYGRPLTRRD